MKLANEQYPDDISKALCKVVGITNEAEINDCTETMHQLRAIAQNEYNADFYRTFYAVLSKLTDV